MKSKSLKLDNNQLKVLFTFIFVFLIFYWTYLFFSSQNKKLLSELDQSKERYSKVYSLSESLEGKVISKRMNAGLLSYVEQFNDSSLLGKITNIKLISSSGNKEQVAFRAEKLTYAELIFIINNINVYDNLMLNSLKISKRFDDETLADAQFDVVKQK